MATFLPTESYRGKVKARHAGQGDVAVRVFDVVGAADEDEAMDTVYALFGVQVNAPYDPSDQNNVLFCESVVPRYDGAAMQEVTAQYRVPATGYFQPTVPPLTLPWRYEFGESIETPEFDRDVSGNAVLNAAGDPPSNPATRTVTKKTCSIYVNEAFYNNVTASMYENTVNSDTITLTQENGDSTTYTPGTMKCTSYKPSHDYTRFDTHIPTVRTVEMYNPQDINLTEPHQLHLLNRGSQGWYHAGSGDIDQYAGTPIKGNILDARGNQVSADVLLDGTGKPMDTSYTVEGQPPVANPNGLPPGATLEMSADGKVTWLKYIRYKSVPFLPLLQEPT